ncbi:uncharacterized protein MAM_00647 [Metarhizium album ARSEF 1941]|uniref:Uncharacterized protein n=1 Tax=Metarhizium album (strain ARSEF 1941) TaxID=1081103 RepID=A0A0B2X8L9_METAS|nr:uncharacterized protein MAM_00647 [Metarhizium album ARSEF 1941]KHO01646.1 hypothetical protein MAM_00647 [Metarhizium album ARSEF 1941]
MNLPSRPVAATYAHREPLSAYAHFRLNPARHRVTDTSDHSYRASTQNAAPPLISGLTPNRGVASPLVAARSAAHRPPLPALHLVRAICKTSQSPAAMSRTETPRWPPPASLSSFFPNRLLASLFARSPTRSPPRSTSPRPGLPELASPNASPNPNPTLWEQVKATMDKEEYFRQKSRAADLQIKGHTREIAALKRQLADKDRAMERQKRRQKSLEESLRQARLAEREARRRGESADRLRHELQDSKHESRRYRTALAAAFKLIDDLSDKTTLARLLEQTDRQLSRSSCANSTPVRQTFENVAPASWASVKAEESSDDDDGSRGAFGRDNTAMPGTPMKRQAGEDWSGEDSDYAPLAKTRRIGGRSPRKIVLEE